jgi:hypothetical protein
MQDDPRRTCTTVACFHRGCQSTFFSDHRVSVAVRVNEQHRTCPCRCVVPLSHALRGVSGKHVLGIVHTKMRKGIEDRDNNWPGDRLTGERQTRDVCQPVIRERRYTAEVRFSSARVAIAVISSFGSTGFGTNISNPADNACIRSSTLT